jgi:hypothetical protein
MNFNRRLKALEEKLVGLTVTLKLKDGTVHRTIDEKLWATYFETHRVWSEFLRSKPEGQREFGVVPKEVIKAVPLLKTILDTVIDDAPGEPVNLIQVFCGGPAVGNSPTPDVATVS